jgi:hypothetical protein
MMLLILLSMINMSDLSLEAISIYILWAAIAVTLGCCLAGSYNRRIQLRKIKEYNKNVDVFIREVPQVQIGENKEVIQYITYSPHYKRAVCADSGQEIEFINECIICDFPADTDYANHQQVNTLLVFWKRQYDIKYSKTFTDHPLRLFTSEKERDLFWMTTKLENAKRDLSIF